MRIAFAGNPNSGKTTMYNALTGRNEKVGNWAGVTVEKKEHPVKKSFHSGAGEVIAVDLPGAYSMSPFTSEESITSDYVKKEQPDVIVNIVDATNLSRSLFFTTQLLELGIPVVVALNKSDINEKKNTEINASVLAEKLGCPVVETVSTNAQGLERVVKTAIAQVGKRQTAPYEQGIVDLTSRSAVEAADRKRYAFVNNIVSHVEKRRIFMRNKNMDDKIDEILTSRWFGIPIFTAVMFLVFQISQVWVGPFVADTFVAQMQDYLGLGAEGRMNTPGTASGNWQWRLKKGEATEELAERMQITPSNLSILKTGKAKAIRFSTLNEICKALECEVGDILEYVDDRS